MAAHRTILVNPKIELKTYTKSFSVNGKIVYVKEKPTDEMIDQVVSILNAIYLMGKKDKLAEIRKALEVVK